MITEEELKRIQRILDWRKTDGDVLIHLVNASRRLSSHYRREVENLHGKINSLYNELKNIVKTKTDVKHSDVADYYVGVDGSYYVIDGVAGTFFGVYAAAFILLDKNNQERPITKFVALPLPIKEVSDKSEAQKKVSMHTFETEIRILDRGFKDHNSIIEENKTIVMLDGPIVDPPYNVLGSQFEEEYSSYVTRRTNVIKKISNMLNETYTIVVGCVKRSRDLFILEAKPIHKDFDMSRYEKMIKEFRTDQRLFLYLFYKFRREENYLESLYTPLFHLSYVNEQYKLYSKEGIDIFSFFYQKSISHPVIRVDMAIPKDSIEDIGKISVLQDIILSNLDFLTFEGLEYPLPVYLAHVKSMVSKGLVETLYYEIITGAYEDLDKYVPDLLMR